MTSYLRPDEMASESQIERGKNEDRLLKKGIKGISSVAIGFAAPAIASKIAPFLSEFIPADLAMKGINKLSPALGSFLKKGQKAGLDVKSGLQYIKENLISKKNKEKSEEPTQDNRNIVEQYSPELHQFMKNQVDQGKDSLLSGAEALKNPKFQAIIKKMQADHKAPWSAILQTVYGQGQAQQPNQTQQPQQQMPQQRQQQQDPNAMFMTALDKIMKM